jgi:hypothetical protein
MARLLICASHKNVKAIDTVPTAAITSVSSVLAPSASNQERTIAKNEICIHFGHLPRFRRSNILIKNDAVSICCAFRLGRREAAFTYGADPRLGVAFAYGLLRSASITPV